MAGLSEYQPATDDFVSYGDRRRPAPCSPTCTSAPSAKITPARSGSAPCGGGLNRFDPHTGRVTVFRHDPQDPHSLSHDHVWSILEDDAQRLWVATADGLNLFDARLRHIRALRQ